MTPVRPIRVLLVDDNAVVRAVLRDMLSGSTAGIDVVGEAANGIEALEFAGQLRPDVTILDHRMPLRDGLSVVSGVSEFSRVLMLTRTVDDATVLTAVRRGALGYLVYGQFTPAELVHAIRAVAGGDAHLSPTAARILVTSVRQNGEDRRNRYRLSTREREVMNLVTQDFSNADIAEVLVLAPKTVENHVNHIFAKLRVGSRGEAIAVWLGSAG